MTDRVEMDYLSEELEQELAELAVGVRESHDNMIKYRQEYERAIQKYMSKSHPAEASYLNTITDPPGQEYQLVQRQLLETTDSNKVQHISAWIIRGQQLISSYRLADLGMQLADTETGKVYKIPAFDLNTLPNASEDVFEPVLKARLLKIKLFLDTVNRDYLTTIPVALTGISPRQLMGDSYKGEVPDASMAGVILEPEGDCLVVKVVNSGDYNDDQTVYRMKVDGNVLEDSSEFISVIKSFLLEVN